MFIRPFVTFAVSKIIKVRILVVLLLFTLQLKTASSQSIDYASLFADDWKKAEAFEKENRSWIKPLLEKNRISYPLAMSIVFPEMVRYSALRDKMEISLLKTLYVNLGEEYADFSIGIFQMKPSFAETIREESSEFLGSRAGIKFKRTADYEDIKDFRKSIIKDLEDPEGQVVYLISFIRICEKKFNLYRLDELSRIKFLATAYNYGIDKTPNQIVSMTNKKFFSTKVIKSESYCYAEISLHWYNQYVSGNE
jgi:hypothetical protein